ncbi:MAG TPA: hypothetical protein VFN79_06945 [Steroidobacteraceae bacterium]|nr:hypothetical protein [Steroidobacteraceae bacterium]
MLASLPAGPHLAPMRPPAEGAFGMGLIAGWRGPVFVALAAGPGPRHADLLLVTGPVAANMEAALRRVYDAAPHPKLVVATGDCACTGGLLSPPDLRCAPDSFSRGRVSNFIPVDVAVPGCPPTPARIMQGILTAIGPGARGR